MTIETTTFAQSLYAGVVRTDESFTLEPLQKIVIVEATSVAQSSGLDGTIVGPASATLNLFLDASYPPSPSFPNFLGTINITLTDFAQATAFNPDVIANWSGVSPASVANALNRIAAKIGPIP